MRHIGLHLRLKDSIIDAAARAVRLNTPIFQCFLVKQTSGHCIHVSEKTIVDLQKFWEQIHTVYIHGSYWINLAGLKPNGHRALTNEMELAKRLGCTNLILHPGSATKLSNHQQRIDALARIINEITKKEKAITFILENTAHGKASVGSNLEDFYHLKQKLDYPEQISFCIDTAHAHSYGYDLVDTKKRDEFISLVDQTMGIDNVKLIHLNDAAHERGTRIDKHALIGEGHIGQDALKAFISDPRLLQIPLILELPVLPEAEEDGMLQKIRDWHL